MKPETIQDLPESFLNLCKAAWNCACAKEINYNSYPLYGLTADDRMGVTA